MADNLSPKEILINSAFKTWFNSRYQELISSELLAKWQKVDTAIQMGIAATGTGSAIAGLQLWENAEMKIVWTVLSFVISIAALWHKFFRITDKIETWSKAEKAFSVLKNQLETLKYQIDIAPKEKIDDVNKQYLAILESYKIEDASSPEKDTFLKKALEDKMAKSIYNSNEQTEYSEELKKAKDKKKKANITAEEVR